MSYKTSWMSETGKNSVVSVAALSNDQRAEDIFVTSHCSASFGGEARRLTARLNDPI